MKSDSVETTGISFSHRRCTSGDGASGGGRGGDNTNNKNEDKDRVQLRSSSTISSDIDDTTTTTTTTTTNNKKHKPTLELVEEEKVFQINNFFPASSSWQEENPALEVGPQVEAKADDASIVSGATL